MFEFRLPDLGEGIHEGELLQWHVTQGDSLKEDDPLCDMETDKAAVTIPSPKTGVVTSLNGRPGDIVRVGEVLAVIDDGTGKEKMPAAQDVSPVEAAPVLNSVIAAPATRRMAREMGVDIKTIMGTGPGGRITPEDLKAQAGPETKSPDIEAPDIEDLAPQPLERSSIPFFEILPLPHDQGPVERIPIRSLGRRQPLKQPPPVFWCPMWPIWMRLT